MKIIDKKGVEEMEVAQINLVAMVGNIIDDEGQANAVAAIGQLKINLHKKESHEKVKKFLKEVARMFGEILDFDNS